ncbi:histidine--tRNA ligase [Rubrivirga marina]|uniref:Histidine--tRNA ligase n=1 Tax=Rubrivirga marina TaxID=1196024 RepID=A0A271J2F9_9BACT|nr:histidine--tRNA ligase [Rubrivirga marina]PAP76899.1 histidine--tRNA ligase [Rubrivirga marina]
MAYQTIRGTFDVLPDAHSSGGSEIPGSSAWRHVEGVVRGVMERFAFEEVRTPVIEPLELVARGVGGTTDIVQKEMFTVERTKETYVLRPEVTAPVMRAYLQHHLDQRGGAQRLYYLGPCFRAERPQKGRFRQFHQFGTELLGSDDPRADAEVIANMRAVYDAFGVTNTRLRLNTLGDAADRPAYRDALRQYFEPHADVLSDTSRQRLETNPLRILDTKDPDERALLADAPKLPDFVGDEALAHYETVKTLLDGLGVPYVEDPLLVRGLDYYTRTVFELESDALGAQGALCAGGRYDGLAQAVGSKRPVPAVGYAAGIERLFIALEDEGYAFPAPPRPDVFLVCLGDAAEAAGFGIAQTLRQAGLAVDFALGGRSMKAQMKAADRSQAGYSVILGEDELAQGVAQVRDLGESEQRAVPIGRLAVELVRETAA